MSTTIKECLSVFAIISQDSTCHHRSQVVQGNFDSQVNQTKSAMEEKSAEIGSLKSRVASIAAELAQMTSKVRY